MKKAQITIFIIAALILVFFIGFMLMSRNAVINKADQIDIEQASLQAEKIVNTCLESKTIEAIQRIPIRKENEELQADYIENGVKKCADFSTIKGADISAGSARAIVYLSDTTLKTELEYPIIIKGDEGQKQISSFSSTISRETRLPLELETGVMQETKVIVSGNKKLELTIPKGTIVTKENVPIDEIQIKLLDKNYNNRGNTVVAGNVIYEGLPDGATFEPYAEVALKFDEADVPAGASKESMSIVYFDEKKDFWVGLESEVDKEANVIRAKIKHFSALAMAAGCGASDKTSRQVMQLGWLYREPCYIGDRAGTTCLFEWELGDDGSIYAPRDTDVNVDMRFLIKDGTRASCYKNDWDKNPNTPETYGYKSVEDVGGKSSFTLDFTGQDGGNLCIYEKDPVKLELHCDDECKVKFNGAEVQKGEFGKYEAKLNNVAKTNIFEVEVINKYAACSGTNGELEFTGIGLLTECKEGEIGKNCKCGSNNIMIVYDREKLLEIMEKEKKTYNDLSNEKLKEAILEENKAYCCSGEISKSGCSGKELKQVEQEKPIPKETKCTIQDRINYLCKYGANNDENYNPSFPACSGVTQDGRPIGFSDTSIGEELSLLTSNERSKKLADLAEYSTGAYSSKSYCTKIERKPLEEKPKEPPKELPIEQPKEKLDFCSDKKNGQYCSNPGKSGEIKKCVNGKEEFYVSYESNCLMGQMCIANDDGSFKECKSNIPEGKLVMEGNNQKAYAGNEAWKQCNLEKTGETVLINGKNQYELLCHKNNDKFLFVSCDGENLKDEFSTTKKDEAIIEVNGKDYLCNNKKWQVCNKENENKKIEDKNLYCCSGTYRNEPCNKISEKENYLCLHAQFFDEVTEDKQIELTRAIGASYIKVLFPWSIAERDKQGAYDWSTFDRQFGKIRSKNLKVVARLSIAPKWARTQDGINTNIYEGYCGGFKKPGEEKECDSFRPDLDKFDAFGNFVYEFVKRYNPEYLQIWNEPNLAGEWANNGVKPEEYAKLLKVSYEAAKKANKDTKIILAGLAPSKIKTYIDLCNKDSHFCSWANLYGNEYFSYDEFEYISKMHSSDPNIGAYYDAIGLNPHPFSDTEVNSVCEDNPKVSNNGMEEGWMLKSIYDSNFNMIPEDKRGGDCWAFDKVRLFKEYMAKKIGVNKQIVLMEFSYYITSFKDAQNGIDDIEDIENIPEELKKREERQAKQLLEGYNKVSTEWKDWTGPVCWFIATKPENFPGDGNMFRKDYSVRASAITYANKVAFKPLSGPLAVT